MMMTTSRRRRKLNAKDEHGSAMVEFAITMLAIVPIFLYSLFIGEMLYYRLVLQEAVTTTTWDFAFQDFEQFDDHRSKVQHHNRLTWCNHSSVYDSFNQEYDCEDEDHHDQLGAHHCWLNDASEQVTCTHDSDFAAPWSWNRPATAFHDEYTTGGLFSCKARAGVLNYLIPNSFMQEFASEQLIDREKYTHGEDGVHEAAEGAEEEDFYNLREQEFALFTDTWAVNHTTKDNDYALDRHTDNVMFDRVSTVFRGETWFWIYGLRVLDFFNTADSEGLLSPLLTAGVAVALFGGTDILGPTTHHNPLIPSVAMLHEDGSPPPKVSQREHRTVGSIHVPLIYRTSDYHATPWTDFADDAYSETWENRGDYYMGNEEAEQSPQEDD